MSKIWFVIITLLIAVVIILFIPGAAIAILIVNALLAGVIVITQLLAVLTKPKQIAPDSGSTDYFVSIHVPCHDEPFGVVKKTLASLAKLDYQNYEVIVIDNNTHDPRTWQPIQDYCAKLGPKFKFLHFENLGGYKAGALNAALKHVDPKTEIIAIVDADYVVKKDFLSLGIPYFRDPSIAIVQYPQAYYNSGPKTVGLEQEYRSFFDNIFEQANSLNAVTAAGTLSFLRAKLFISNLLNWNEWCITEDTELGIYLHGLGYKGVFINHVLGQGLMPFDYYSLERQRERWVHGNTQIIRKDLISIIRNPRITWKQKLSFITQLTAWFHPNFFPMIFLTLALIQVSYSELTLQLALISWISLLTIIGFIFAKTIYFLLGQLRRNILSVSLLVATVLSHFGLTGTMSLTWLWALTSSNLPFNRTTKDPSEKITPYLPVDGFLAICLFIGSIVAVIFSTGSTKVTGFIGIGIACFFTLSLWFLIWQARAAKHLAHTYIASPNEN